MEQNRILINYYKKIMSDGKKGKYFALVERKSERKKLVKKAECELEIKGIKITETEDFKKLKELINNKVRSS